MNAIVRTVTGDISPTQLGRTDYHEHLLQSTPLLPGDDLDDIERSSQEARLLHDAGIDALIELTPLGIGRDPLGLRAISQQTGLTIVMATGIHREEHYATDDPIRVHDVDALVGWFVEELTISATDGPESPAPVEDVQLPRAGVIKVGAGYWSISAFERRNLEAAAEAQRRTDAAIVCHLELGTAAFEVLSLLVDAGASADRIVLAHVDRNPDAGLHLELAAAGAYLGYDGAGRTKYWPDQVLLDCLLEVAQQGGGDRILVGGDVARRSSFVAYGGMPGMSYLPERFLPRLRREGGDELFNGIMVANPARAFTIRAER